MNQARLIAKCPLLFLAVSGWLSLSVAQQADRKELFPFRVRQFLAPLHGKTSLISEPVKRNHSLPPPAGLKGGNDPILHKSIINGNVYESWVHRYNSNALPSDDYANACATDYSGNVYVTGVSYSTYSGADYLTVKYNSRGDTLWSRRYNGTGNDYDEASAIGVDALGNVYTAGISYNEATGFDIVTIKYRNDGSEEWVREYDSGSDSTDAAVAISVNSDGDVCVSGYGYKTGTDFDILTIMYAASGAEKWVKSFNGTAGGDDRATAMFIDSENNVHITGYSEGIGTGTDYLTIKYDSDGIEAWSDRYTPSFSSIDVATDIIADSHGNTFVTGYSDDQGTKYNFLTISYDRSGLRRWIAAYNDSLDGNDIATSIDADADGNTYVAGGSYGGNTGEDFLTVKYDSAGEQKWTRRFGSSINLSDFPVDLIVDDKQPMLYVIGHYGYPQAGTKDIAVVSYSLNGSGGWIALYNGDGYSDDYPAALSLDFSGNLYVVGASVGQASAYDFVVLKYMLHEIDQWPARFNNGSDNNWFAALTDDSDGNIIATGTDSNHYVTVKFDASGSVRWVAEFGSVHSEPAGIVSDNSGNIYVAGSSVGSGGNLDFATVKYSPDGAELWSSWYDGTAGGNDRVSSIASDSSGNIYVTGTSPGSGTNDDIVTIKYTSSGTEQWVSRLNGAANLNESPAGIAVDRSGNVYIAGSSVRFGTSNDYLTIKLGPDGVKAWEAYYDGTGNKSDYARAIALDSEGNVYITGKSFGAGTSTDYATIKYTPLGVQRWVARYNGPGNYFDDPVAIVIDDESNVFVTGITGSESSQWNYATVKYDLDGNFRWANLFTGTGNGPDIPSDIKIDADGNVVVAGSSYNSGSLFDYAAVKYGTDGSEIWVSQYSGLQKNTDEAIGLVLDPSGYIFIGGNSIGNNSKVDYLITKLLPSGRSYQLWPVRTDGPGKSIDRAKGAALDSEGNILVGGTSYFKNSSEDFQVIKYKSNGDLIWNASFDGPIGNDDNVTAIVTDTENNVYVTGTLYAIFAPCDYGTAKYTGEGLLEWARVYNGPANSFDFASSIAVDGDLNVYVTGYSVGTFSYDYVTIKYDRAGEEQWIARYDGPIGGDDLAYSVGLDRSGNVYVTGLSYGPGSGADYATVKYSPDGNEQWVARYNGPPSGDDRAQRIVLDGEGSVIVTGWSVGNDTTYDIATVKYDSSGTLMWDARYSAGIKTHDQAKAVGTDSDGNIFVTGATYTTDYNSTDYITVKYDREGIEQWGARYDGGINGEDRANGLAIDDSGSVYVTGKSTGADMSTDFATVKYGPGGEADWIARYNSCKKCEDEASTVVLDRNGDVFVIGTSKSSAWSIITTIKYSQTNTDVDGEPTGLPDKYQLVQNYPNPFNASTVIRYNLPERGRVTLKVYNTLGQEVAILADGIQEPGFRSAKLDGSRLPSGMYIYRLSVNGFTESKKLLMVK